VSKYRVFLSDTFSSVNGLSFGNGNEIRLPTFRFHRLDALAWLPSDLNPTCLPYNCRTEASARKADAEDDGNRGQEARDQRLPEFQGHDAQPVGSTDTQGPICFRLRAAV